MRKIIIIALLGVAAACRVFADPGQDLATGVLNNKIKDVQSALKKGADVNAQDDSGNTALHQAAARGYLDLIKVLIAAKADPTRKNGGGFTPARIAVETDKAAVVEYLLTAGTDRRDFINSLSEKDTGGFTAFHEKARSGQLEMIKLFIKYGLDVNVKSNEGYTPLFLVLSTIHDDYNKTKDRIAKLLLENKADPLAVGGRNGESPLTLALTQKKPELFQLMAKSVKKAPGALVVRAYSVGTKDQFALLFPRMDDLNAADAEGRTLLHLAALKKDKALAAELLKRGAKIDVTDRDNRQPHMLAVEAGDAVTLTLLLSAGADVNYSSRMGLVTTALNIAVDNGNKPIIDLLLKKGASLNPKNGFLPLEIAIIKNRLDIFKYLIARGADVNYANDLQMSPLHICIWSKELRPGQRLEYLEYLLKNGADPNKKAGERGSPTEWAVANNATKEIEILKKYGGLVP
jgi:uncharacterized protein